MASQTAPSQIRAIAATQKQLLWVILAAIGFAVVNAGFNLNARNLDPQIVPVAAMAILGLAVVMAVVQIVAVIRLCLALGEGWATIFYAVMMFIPCISLLFLLILNSRATTRLKQAGIRVGLFGARWSDVENYQVDKAAIACPTCGEPITGDAKTCPMCGATV